MVVKGYEQFGAKHHETGALRNCLAHLGVAAPHTGKPYTEEMLLGLGGGIGVAYWVFEWGPMATLYLGTRWGGKELYEATFLENACQRVGARATVKECGGAKAAAAALAKALESGRPAIVWTDLASLPYYALPREAQGMNPHVVVVYGLDGDRALIADRSDRPLTLTAGEMAAARGRIAKLKNRLMTVEAPEGDVDLEAGVVAGIRDCCRQMLEPPMANFGLPALEKWADLVTNAKDKKGDHPARLYSPTVLAAGRDQPEETTEHAEDTEGVGSSRNRLNWILLAPKLTSTPSRMPQAFK